MPENPYEFNNPETSQNSAPDDKNNADEYNVYTNLYTSTSENVQHPSVVEQPAYEQNPYRAGECEWYGNMPAQPVYNPVPPVREASYSKNANQHKRMPLIVIVLICALVSAAFGSVSAVFVNSYLNESSASVTLPDTDEESENKLTNTSPLTTELTTTEVVEKYADSVVEIITEYVQTGMFSQQYIKSGAGSGVIIDSEGYIVTNHHVIENAERISVTLRDGTILQAELVGTDAKMDLALLKVEGAQLSSAVLGNSDNLKVGQRTIAIGNPLGQLGGTVTEGIISALDRAVTVDGQTMNLLQTDTAINPGNSGGGLFDGNGNLIGIVVAKSSGSEVEGLGFAIPINDAVDVISDLIDYGYVRGRISIGMEFLDVTSEPVAWMYGLNSLGCYVYSVDNNSNAYNAGFKSGDLILEVNGEQVETSADIEKYLEDKQVGDEIKFTIMRGRNKGSLSLILQEYVPEDKSESDDYLQWYYD